LIILFFLFGEYITLAGGLYAAFGRELRAESNDLARGVLWHWEGKGRRGTAKGSYNLGSLAMKRASIVCEFDVHALCSVSEMCTARSPATANPS